MLLNGVDIRQIQEYLGHTNVETTMIYVAAAVMWRAARLAAGSRDPPVPAAT